jgi:hypothetical protein
LSPSSLSTFAGVVAGDTVFIPDTTTGDAASPFGVANTGFWVVLALLPNGIGADRKLVCNRPSGYDFVGVTEVVQLTDDAEFQAFSSGPVQIGDFIELISGFSVVSRKAYQVTAVTDSWVEFASGESLPLEADVIPTASGIAVYSDAQSFTYIETDQEAVIRINGMTDDNLKTQPRKAADIKVRGIFELTGVIWKLVIVNRSPSASMRALVIAARVQE